MTFNDPLSELPSQHSFSPHYHPHAGLAKKQQLCILGASAVPRESVCIPSAWGPATARWESSARARSMSASLHASRPHWASRSSASSAAGCLWLHRGDEGTSVGGAGSVHFSWIGLDAWKGQDKQNLHGSGQGNVPVMTFQNGLRVRVDENTVFTQIHTNTQPVHQEQEENKNTCYMMVSIIIMRYKQKMLYSATILSIST